MPCDVLTLIMRRESAFYAEGTNRGTIAEDSSQKKLVPFHSYTICVLVFSSGYLDGF